MVVSNLNIHPGVSETLLELLSIKVRGMGELEKLCIICLDEMSFKSELTYNPQTDEVEGYVDNWMETKETMLQPMLL